jgi:hypothetical protein
MIALGLAASGASGGSPIHTARPTHAPNHNTNVKFVDLHPFTHTAYIPANADATTIRMTGVERTKVFTQLKQTFDMSDCDTLKFRDPGGSMYCPSTEAVNPAPAYAVKYSFIGPPLASDEYNNRYFTFRVLFRSGELPASLERTLLGKKVNKAQMARDFKLTTLRENVPATVIDEAHSDFCAGHHFFGFFHPEPNCVDKVVYKQVMVPSDYLTIRVDPAVARSDAGNPNGSKDSRELAVLDQEPAAGER